MNLNEKIKASSYLDLPNIFYNYETITPLKDPFLLHVNRDLAKEVNLDTLHDKTICKVLNGESVAKNSKPFSMCYAGHQFGHFVPRLGDGRAINIGECSGYKLQLKGSGQTLYPRQGDGRAVLRSSIREYLMAEAMHHLGVPTSRSLAIIGSNENVARERWEKGSIVLRMAPSWVRFGTFEYFYHSNRYSDLEHLTDYVIKESYPHLKDKENSYFLMIEELVEKTAKLMAQWQAIGFNHGVMNTDNMSIAGITIDYGPFALLDEFNHDNICNHTDVEGRYRFSNQPYIAKWNLQRLMVALSPLVNFEKMNTFLDNYDDLYITEYLRLMRQMLGFLKTLEEDKDLNSELFEIMQNSRVDYHAFFRALCRFDNREKLHELCLDTNALNAWLDKYLKRLEKEKKSPQTLQEEMLHVNPKYVLKNHLLQEAIEYAQKGDFTMVEDLMKLIKDPFSEHKTFEEYASVTPKYLSNLKLSCSS